MQKNKQQVTSIYFFHFQGLKNKAWAFKMMNSGHRMLDFSSLQFYKLMGSGKGKGFNPFPDWSTYVLLTIWDSEEAAQDFHDNSKIIAKYQKRTSSIDHYLLQNIRSAGQWSGSNPFQDYPETDPTNSKIAVITRATIKPSKLITFWKNVPASAKAIDNAKGLLFTKGIGEAPIMQMATFSIWETKEDLKEYAYNSRAHLKAISLTRKLDWYKEELFARFIILDQYQ